MMWAWLLVAPAAAAIRAWWPRRPAPLAPLPGVTDTTQGVADRTRGERLTGGEAWTCGACGQSATSSHFHQDPVTGTMHHGCPVCGSTVRAVRNVMPDNVGRRLFPAVPDLHTMACYWDEYHDPKKARAEAEADRIFDWASDGDGPGDGSDAA